MLSSPLLRLAVSFATTTAASASHISRGNLAPRLNRLASSAAATKRHFTLHQQFDEPRISRKNPSSDIMASSGEGESECKDGLRIAVEGCVRIHPTLPTPHALLR